MPNLTREMILEANDVQSEPCEVPEWGGTVYVRVMSGAQRDVFEQWAIDRRSNGGQQSIRDLKALMVVLSVVDAEGKPLFELKDLALIQTKNYKAIDRIFQMSDKVNKISDKEIEEIAGNS